MLFVGGKVAAGTATSGVLYKSIANDNSEDTLFGANSMLAGMIREAKKINKVTRIDAIPLDDAGGGVAATGTFGITGTKATEAGTLIFTVGSDTNHKYSVAIAVDDTPTDVGDALDALILADTDAPFSSANVTGTITITADNKGTDGNKIGLRIEGTVAGLTLAVTGMTNGATNPTLTDVFDVCAEIRYQGVVFPSGYGVTFVTTDFLDTRFNIANIVLDGVGITSITNTYADHIIALATPNSQSLTYFCNKLVDDTLYKGSALFELDYIIASQFAAIRALRLTTDADTSSYIVASGAGLDTVGGSKLASKPYFNTPFPTLSLIDQDKAFITTEIDALIAVGGSVIVNNSADTGVVTRDVTTTYKTDAVGNTDTTWKYLNSVDTFSNAAEYFFNNLKARFSQHRLTEGDIIPDIPMANEDSIRAYLVKLYGDLSGADYVLLQAGDTAVNYFKDNLSLILDIQAGSVAVSMKVKGVGQLRAFTITMQVTF